MKLTYHDAYIEKSTFPAGPKDGDQYAVRDTAGIWHILLPIKDEGVFIDFDGKEFPYNQVKGWVRLPPKGE